MWDSQREKEAQRAAADFKKRLAEGFEQTDIKLIDFLEKWVDEYKRGVRKNRIELHEYNIKQHIKPIMYQKFINSLLDNDTAEEQLSSFIPCVGVEFKGTQKKEGIKFIESSDIPRFLQTAHIYGYIYWILFQNAYRNRHS